MNYYELSKQSRAEIREQFGEVGVKKDCKFYLSNGGEECRILNRCPSGHNRNYLVCEREVCYFYKKRRV